MSRVNKANKMLWSKQKFIPGIHHYSQTNVKNTAHSLQTNFCTIAIDTMNLVYKQQK